MLRVTASRPSNGPLWVFKPSRSCLCKKYSGKRHQPWTRETQGGKDALFITMVFRVGIGPRRSVSIYPTVREEVYPTILHLDPRNEAPIAHPAVLPGIRPHPHLRRCRRRTSQSVVCRRQSTNGHRGRPRAAPCVPRTRLRTQCDRERCGSLLARENSGAMKGRYLHMWSEDRGRGKGGGRSQRRHRAETYYFGVKMSIVTA